MFKLTKTLSFTVSTLTSSEETSDFICSLNSFASITSFELLLALSPSSISDFRSKFFCSESEVCCLRFFVTEGAGDGLKFNDNTVVPFGCSTTGTTF